MLFPTKRSFMEFNFNMEINEDEILKYKKLTNQLKIKKETKNIKLELEKLSVREEIEAIDLSKEKKDLQTRLEILTDEGDFNDYSKNFDILLIKEEISNYKSRLIKLNEKKDSISPDVFEKLKTEYEDNLNQNISYSNEQIEKISSLNNNAIKFLSTYNESKEELKIRKSLNELNEMDYDKKIKNLEENKKKADSIFELTQLLLEELEN